MVVKRVQIAADWMNQKESRRVRRLWVKMQRLIGEQFWSEEVFDTGSVTIGLVEVLDTSVRYNQASLGRNAGTFLGSVAGRSENIARNAAYESSIGRQCIWNKFAESRIGSHCVADLCNATHYMSWHVPVSYICEYLVLTRRTMGGQSIFGERSAIVHCDGYYLDLHCVRHSLFHKPMMASHGLATHRAPPLRICFQINHESVVRSEEERGSPKHGAIQYPWNSKLRRKEDQLRYRVTTASPKEKTLILINIPLTPPPWSHSLSRASLTHLTGNVVPRQTVYHCSLDMTPYSVGTNRQVNQWGASSSLSSRASVGLDREVAGDKPHGQWARLNNRK
ncbi:hypothetical protein DFH29DRAFT_878830 [Suillus ampliporus]|nr:hypothetical protein DFH29DRAFT_878830 [Suillus ampliporus]